MEPEVSADADLQEEGTQEAAQPESQKEDVIPKRQFLAALASANRKYDDLKSEFETLKAAQAKPAPTQYSRLQLQQFVEEGKITQADSDNLWERNIRESTKHEVLAAVGAESVASKQSATVAAELTAYSELVPEVLIEGSTERKKVEREFLHLVSLGYQQTKATEAVALRAAFGDLANLRATKQTHRGPADAHVETGGGRPPGGSEKDPVKALDARTRSFYQKGIDSGRYKDWGAVREELKFRRK